METIFEFSPLIVAIVPVVLGLVQVAKGMGIPSRYAPVASIVLGVALMLITGAVWQAAVVQGIIAGLAASGLWSGSKSTFEG